MAIQIEHEVVGKPIAFDGLEPLAAINSPENGARNKKRHANMGEYAEWRIKAKLGVYPIDHPVSQYASLLSQRLLGSNPDSDQKPKVTVYKGEPNAFVFPNGSTYISDQLLTLADTDEELLFILMHEKVHHQEAHNEKVFNRTEDVEREYRKAMLEGIGMERIHEWEGDLRAFVQLDELGINPEGGLHIMGKFRADEKGGGGLAHGKSTDRQLNLRAVTYLKDLKSLGTPLHKVPEDVKESIQTEEAQGEFSSHSTVFLDSVKSVSHFKATEALGKMDFDQLLIVLPELKHMYDQSLGRSGREGDRDHQAAVFQKRFLPQIGSKIWEKIRDAASVENQGDIQQINFLFHTALATVLDIDPRGYEDVLFDSNLHVKSSDGKHTLAWSKDKFSLANQIDSEEDLDTLIKTLNPKVLDTLGLKLAETPYRLVHSIVATTMDNFVFEPEDSDFQVDRYLEFTQKLVDAFTIFYQDNDAAGFDPDSTFGQIVEEAYEYLGKEDKEVLETTANKANSTVFAKRKAQKEKLLDEERESEAENKLVELFTTFGSDYQKYLQSGHSSLRNQFERDKYFQDVKDVFEGKKFDTKEDLLVFLANFRKSLQGDQALERFYDLSGDQWNALTQPLITDIVEKLQSSNAFTENLDKALFEFKIALLIASSPVSDVLQPNRDETYTQFFKSEELNLDWYRKFHYYATTDNSIGNELGIEVENEKVMGAGPEYNEGWVETFKAGKIRLLHNSFKSSSREEFSQFLESVTNEFPFNYYGDALVRDQIGDYLKDDAEYRREWLKELFEKYSFDLTNTQDLKDLYHLSTYFEDQGMAIRMQNIAWRELSKVTSFEEGFAFLEQELSAKRLLSVGAVNEFVENNARTHGEIEAANQRLLGLLTQESSFEGIGKLILTEQLMARFLLDDKFAMTVAAIGNGEDDTYLKRYLYRKWVACMDYDTNETLGNVHLPDLMQKLYRMDAQSKYVFIRDLLTGDKGILTDPDPEKRVQFVNFFLDNYVEVNGEEDQRFFSVIKDVLDQVARSADYDLLYFAISPLIQDRFLIYPSQQISWDEVIRQEEPPKEFMKEEAVGEVGENKKTKGKLRSVDDLSEYDDHDYEPRPGEKDYYDLDENGEIWGDRIYGKAETETPNTKNYVPSFTTKSDAGIDDKDAKQIYGYITGHEAPNTYDSEDLRRAYEDNVEKLLESVEEKKGKVKMTVNEFLLETAQKLGAPGVRFLQLVGQYVELPPHLEASFNEVYDQVGGQSKVTAEQTLLREWPGARSTLTGLDGRLGGGSLMSVFKTRTEMGQDLAVKVLNPNSSYHTDNTHELLSEVFNVLSERDPQFAPATTLLTDIREWIKGDIDFTDFIKQDQNFRRKHDDYSVRGNKYRISVPHSYFPESKYFALEDYVEGTNLTQIEALQAQGHDPKQIIGLLTRNFFEQVKDGQVHSDIHPGNIRVTADNKVVYLDRNYYLNFSVGERLFLWNLSQNLGNTQRATAMSLDYLGSNGYTIDQVTKDKILEQTEKLDEVADPTQRLMKLAVILRKEGLRFPIKTTLLIKDMFYLDRMAKRVGYSGISEALQS
ncbi:hypothetical protein A2858_02225 [Candidatus Daviesbacteria bacterium RIFCSPHIGHO2_01_FULL_36_37]|uniref:ABC1 atypical kinase-like domain-containing protein n=1 Tax=Candidatus Daviesbacteria bacterium RIFCSPHIGHO2_01_FULL_36_37 TaxID=1797758 RepID=A0A1F5IJV2_9BACT|nr:MAG: hypothetical protein A2858_02225 [Candidatus Daviesbacteria bacterium RIFCSPHIGHO2_01_FULL_36_37]